MWRPVRARGMRQCGVIALLCRRPRRRMGRVGRSWSHRLAGSPGLRIVGEGVWSFETEFQRPIKKEKIASAPDKYSLLSLIQILIATSTSLWQDKGILEYAQRCNGYGGLLRLLLLSTDHNSEMLVCVGIQIQITCEFTINKVLMLIPDDAVDMYVPRLNGHDCSTVFKPCRMEFEKSQLFPCLFNSLFIFGVLFLIQALQKWADPMTYLSFNSHT